MKFFSPEVDLEGGLLAILIDCMNFLPPFLDVRHLFNCMFFLNRFHIYFNLFALLYHTSTWLFSLACSESQAKKQKKKSSNAPSISTSSVPDNSLIKRTT